METGTCKYGDKCIFSHDAENKDEEEEGEEEQEEEEASEAAPKAKAKAKKRPAGVCVPRPRVPAVSCVPRPRVPALCARFSARGVHPDSQPCSLATPAGPKLPCSPPQAPRGAERPNTFQPSDWSQKSVKDKWVSPLEPLYERSPYKRRVCCDWLDLNLGHSPRQRHPVLASLSDCETRPELQPCTPASPNLLCTSSQKVPRGTGQLQDKLKKPRNAYVTGHPRSLTTPANSRQDQESRGSD